MNLINWRGSLKNKFEFVSVKKCRVSLNVQDREVHAKL